MTDAKRRLAAILGADVAGYSRLMGDDERATLDTLNTYRAVFRHHIAARDGRVVDTAGDSVLAVFDSVVEALHCALDVQVDLAARNAELVETRRMLFRIGLNLGDVIEQADGTVYGDGVNVAARVEGLADPGEICIAEAAHFQVRGKFDNAFEDLGEHQVKNIAEPIRVFRVKSATPTVTASAGSDAPYLRSKASIAVLPFDNLSGDVKWDSFVDGIVEQLIAQLSKFELLDVIARNSSFRFKGQAVDVREVGRALVAEYVVEGSMRKAGETIRLTAQLLNAETGAHLWADTYQRQLTDDTLFDVQDDLTARLVATIGDPGAGAVSRAGFEATKARAVSDLSIYECILQAHALYTGSGGVDSEQHLRARAALERAAELDPNSAEVRAWLAWSYADEHRYGHNPRPDSLGRALREAEQAVRLDQASATAHFALAGIQFHLGNFDEFRREADRAVQLNPHEANTLATIGSYECFLGNFEKGVALTEKAIALNPYHPTWYFHAFILDRYHAKDYEAALKHARQFEIPGFWGTYSTYAMIYGQLGQTDLAVKAIDQLLALQPDFLDQAWRLAAGWRHESMVHFVAAEIEGLRKAGLDIPDRTEAA